MQSARNQFKNLWMKDKIQVLRKKTNIIGNQELMRNILWETTYEKQFSFTNLYVLKVLIHHSIFGYAVSFVETEFLTECVFTEPNLYKGVHESFVEVICHTITILDLTYHVTNSTPADPLKPSRNHWLQLIPSYLLRPPLEKTADVPCLSHSKESYFPITLFFIIVLHSLNTCKDFSKWNLLKLKSILKIARRLQIYLNSPFT